jgi:DNA-binding beta-propeller fold protein YncE
VGTGHDGSVTPIDTATGTARKPVPVPGSPLSIAIGPDGKTAYVGSFRPGTLTAIPTATNRARHPVLVGPAGPITVVIAP